MPMYHLVTDLETLFPSLDAVVLPKMLYPSVPLTAAPGEDTSTPRVPAARSVARCVTSIGATGRFRRCLAANDCTKSYAEVLDEAYPVLVLELPSKSGGIDWIDPGEDKVPDVARTGEKWSLSPVPVLKAEIRWLDAYSIRIDEDTCDCKSVSFLDDPSGRDHPWLNGKGHPLDCSQMDYDPWPGNDPCRNRCLDRFLFRETATRLRLPVYAAPAGNAYAECRPAGVCPDRDAQLALPAGTPFRVPVEKLRPFSRFYDEGGQPLFADDAIRSEAAGLLGRIVDTARGPRMFFSGRPDAAYLYDMPHDERLCLAGIRLHMD